MALDVNAIAVSINLRMGFMNIQNMFYESCFHVIVWRSSPYDA